MIGKYGQIDSEGWWQTQKALLSLLDDWNMRIAVSVAESTWALCVNISNELPILLYCVQETEQLVNGAFSKGRMSDELPTQI